MKRKKALLTILIALVLLGTTACSEKFESVDDYMVAGKSLMDQGEYRKSIELYEEGVEVYSHSEELLMALAKAYSTSMQADKAENTLVRVLKLNNSNRLAYRELQNMYDERLENEDHIIEVCKDNGIDIPGEILSILFPESLKDEENEKEKSEEESKPEVDVIEEEIIPAPKPEPIKETTQSKPSQEKPAQEGEFTQGYETNMVDGYGRRIYRATQTSSVNRNPSLNSESIAIIHRGDLITELNPVWSYEQDDTGRDRAWINVLLADGGEGWISKRALDNTNRDR